MGAKYLSNSYFQFISRRRSKNSCMIFTHFAFALCSNRVCPTCPAHPFSAIAIRRALIAHE